VTERDRRRLLEAHTPQRRDVRISHVGHVVRRTEAAEKAYGRHLGLDRAYALDLSEQALLSTMLRVGSHHVELLEPTGDQGPIRKFLQGRGEGLYHVCLATPDVDAEIARLQGRGVRVVDLPPTPTLPARTAWIRIAGASFEVAPEALLSRLEAIGRR
jgi:methylmalonyl-CoA/ethylmalonyl-CoA epimerase